MVQRRDLEPLHHVVDGLLGIHVLPEHLGLLHPQVVKDAPDQRFCVPAHRKRGVLNDGAGEIHHLEQQEQLLFRHHLPPRLGQQVGAIETQHLDQLARIAFPAVIIHRLLERTLVHVVHRVVQVGPHHVADGYFRLALQSHRVPQHAGIVVPLLPLQAVRGPPEIGFHPHGADPKAGCFRRATAGLRGAGARPRVAGEGSVFRHGGFASGWVGRACLEGWPVPVEWPRVGRSTSNLTTGGAALAI